MQDRNALFAPLAAIAVALPIAFTLAYAWIFHSMHIAPQAFALAATIAAAFVCYRQLRGAGRTTAAAGAIAMSLVAFFLSIFLLTHVVSL